MGAQQCQRSRLEQLRSPVGPNVISTHIATASRRALSSLDTQPATDELVELFRKAMPAEQKLWRSILTGRDLPHAEYMAAHATVEPPMSSRGNTRRCRRVQAEPRRPANTACISSQHTHASMLLNAGVDVLTVSRRLGHAKASVTLDTYGHKVEGADQAATAAIERVLN